jgi:hypothetical protein
MVANGKGPSEDEGKSDLKPLTNNPATFQADESASLSKPGFQHEMKRVNTAKCFPIKAIGPIKHH